MAITTSTARSSAVTTQKFATAKLLTDTATATTYGDMRDYGNAVVSVRNTPKSNNNVQYASGVAVASYTAKAGGT